MSENAVPTSSVKVTISAWEELFRAQVAVMRYMTAMPEFKKLSMREYDVLFNLRNCPGGKSRLVDLNQHLLISQPSLSRMVSRLEERGLVARTVDPEDQRAMSLSLTDAGRQVQRDIGLEHIKHLHELLGRTLSEDEFIELQRLCNKLRSGIS